MARAPKLNSPKRVITHHSNGTPWNPLVPTQHHTVFIIDDDHATKWPGFTSRLFRRSDNNELFHSGYHWVINSNDGFATQTRGYNEEGAHCIGQNTSSVGVLFIGNFTEGSGERPLEPGLKTWREKVWPDIHKNFPNITQNDIVPHRRYATKDCHGSSLSDTFFRDKLFDELPVDEKQKEIDNLNAQITIYQSLVQLLIAELTKLVQFMSGRRLSLKENRKKV